MTEALEVEELFMATPASQGAVFLAQLDGARSYVCRLRVVLVGALDERVFAEAVRALFQRHQALRSAFDVAEGHVTQVVYRDVGVPLSIEESGDRALGDVEGFDTAEPPLIRLRLGRLSAERCALSVVFFHGLLDGWSMHLLIEDLWKLYRALAGGGASPALPAPYRPYAEWLVARDRDADVAYWKKALANDSPAEAELRVGRRAVVTPTTERQTVRRSLSSGLAMRLGEVARVERTTLATFVALAWALVLRRYADQEDVMFGITMAHRPAEVPRAAELVGALFNTVPLRVQLPDGQSVREALATIRDRLVQHQAHAYLSPAEIQRASGVRGDAAQIQTSVRVQTLPPVDLAALPPTLRIEESTLVDEWHYAVCLVVEPRAGGIDCRLDFDPNRYLPDEMARTLGHVEQALEQMSASLSTRLGDIELLTAEEQRIFAAWNGTPYPDGRDSALEIVEEAAVRYADRVVAKFGGRSYTARELMMLAEQREAVLRARGVGAESVVLIEPSARFIELFTLALGVWKAGGAVWVRETRAPLERLRLLASELAVSLYVGSATQAAALGIAATLTLDELIAAANEQPAEPQRRRPHPEAAAVVMLTSGSSGVPNAVVHAQASLAAFARFAGAIGHEPGEGEHFIPSEPFIGFLTAIRRGATALALPPGATWDPEAYTRLVIDEDVRYFTLSPSHLSTLDPSRMPKLRMFSVGGERLSATLVDRWRNQTITQQYMMTETSGGTRGLIGAEYATEPHVGRPAPGRSIYVLDSSLRALPIGVTGQVYFGGPGLARGYAGRPAKTADRFVPDPFSDTPGARMYATGDLGLLYADGRLAVLGRNDRQVKVRGFRVELEEIEVRLLAVPSVQLAAVVQLEHPKLGPVLVAYLQPKSGETLDTAHVRQIAAEQLPDYMRPSSYVILDRMPLSQDGSIKILRHALPAPDWSSLDREHTEPPRPGTESALAAIFGELLGAADVGRRDRFFDLGGHSLLATQLVSRVREEMGVELPVRAVFEAPSIAELALRVESAPQGDAFELVPRGKYPPLSFAQERLWFLENLESTAGAAYHMTEAVRLRGALDVHALRRSIDEVVRRHESLRTTFALHDGTPYQHVREPKSALPVVPLADRVLMDVVAEEWGRLFDRQEGPLFRTTLLRVADDDHVLVITMHHLVSDGSSATVLVRELAALYEAFVAGKPSPLAALPLQYADYAAWQRARLRGEVLEQELAYWKQQLSGAPPLLDLPTDRPRRPLRGFVGQRVTTAISAEQTNALRRVAQRESATLYMALLAAWQVLLSRYSGQTDIVVGFAIANRTRRELEGLVGYFANTLALRTDLGGEPTFRDVLERVKRTLLDAYAHQDVPFERVVEVVNPPRSLRHAPIFQVMFIMHEAPIGQLALPGLTLEPIVVDRDTARFDLVANVVTDGDGLTLRLEYNVDLFDRETIQALGNFYESVLDRMVEELAA